MRAIIATIALALGGSSVSAAAADGPSAEMAGGVSSLASGACCVPTSGTLPIGWYGSVAVPVRRGLAVVGEASGDFERWQAESTVPSFVFPAVRYGIYAFMGGPRLAMTPTSRVRLFGQLLLGLAHREWTARDPAFSFENTGGTNQFALQPGGGIEFVITGPWSIRFEADYRITPIQGLVPPRAALTQQRFTSGLVFRPRSANVSRTPE